MNYKEDLLGFCLSRSGESFEIGNGFISASAYVEGVRKTSDK